ncbi:hypothetical protein [Streptomyces sp. NPDC093598]|uniref:hypothetical protein n=1 Tax=Streptomyces sp. NPDC093598 TaxID=3366046 RepID=UPI0037FB58C1
MGIRTHLSRTASGVARAPVPAFEAAASTVRVPVPFTTALRRATADLRQRLATRGRRPTGSSGTGDLSAAKAFPGVDTVPAGTHGAPGTPGTPGRSSRPWARLARGYLTLVLTLLPRPRPAHTPTITITVYLTTTDSVVSERPGGSAPSRRPGRDRRGPEPDAAP